MVLKEFDIGGNSAIVTGAARGLGKAVALTLAEAGADVAVADFREEVEETARETRELGRKSIAVRTDVREAEQVEHMVQAALAEFGKVDIMVANAGVEWVKPLLLVDGKPPVRMRVDVNLESGLEEEDWNQTFDVNLHGFVRCARAVGPHMIERKRGKIIGIESIAAMRFGANTTAYAASKAAVHRFAQSLAQEWAGFNINVNAIAPGAFGPTPIYWHPEWNITREAHEAALYRINSFIPLQRDTEGWGRPRELGLLVAFLASEAASYITGHVLVADGGVSL